MTSVVLLVQLAAVLLAAFALWSIRHEFAATATTYPAWITTPALAVVVAAILLFVSPGKRVELWLAAIVIGLALGAFAGWLLKINRDAGQELIRVPRTWDGVGATTALLVLTVARFVTSNLMNRQSGKFGVLGAAAAFLAAYLVARYLIARFYKIPRAIHLDMIHGRDPGRTLIG